MTQLYDYTKEPTPWRSTRTKKPCLTLSGRHIYAKGESKCMWCEKELNKTK